ncbi:MAG TPA: hypothetical protein VEV41_19580 [Terriglobales bacterium]|nr:hypothetical protein [Terriglobales bacterium]
MLRACLLLLTGLFLVPVSLCAQDIVCTPTVAIPRQHRTNVKHRGPADASAQRHNTTASQILHWAAPHGITDPKVRKSNDPVDPRESEVYTLTGDLWRVIVEDNDCDFHLELSAPGRPSTSARVIVEVPQGEAFLPQRGKLIEELTANGYSVAVGRSIPLDDPLRVTVTGYGFYDSAHYSKKNPQKGHNHGTRYVGSLWELHPSWEIAFAN